MPTNLDNLKHELTHALFKEIYSTLNDTEKLKTALIARDTIHSSFETLNELFDIATLKPTIEADRFKANTTAHFFQPKVKRSYSITQKEAILLDAVLFYAKQQCINKQQKYLVNIDNLFDSTDLLSEKSLEKMVIECFRVVTINSNIFVPYNFTLTLEFKNQLKLQQYIFNIHEQIDLLKEKADDLKLRGEKDKDNEVINAAHVADKLVNDLEKELKKFKEPNIQSGFFSKILNRLRHAWNSKTPLQIFQENSLEHIKIARPVLEAQRDWGTFLKNLMLCFAGGIGIFSMLSKLFINQYLFFNDTKTVKILNLIENTIKYKP